MPSGSKNSYLTDLPPGKAVGLTGKSAQGVALAGEGFPRQQAHAFMRELKFFLSLTKAVPFGIIISEYGKAEEIQACQQQ